MKIRSCTLCRKHFERRELTSRRFGRFCKECLPKAEAEKQIGTKFKPTNVNKWSSFR